jgi:hypothetical protein
MKLTNIVGSGLLALALSSAALPAAAGDSRALTTASESVVVVPRGATPGSTADEKRYAQRAAKSQDARNFRGGDTIVISASALAVILLVVLIIVLI